MWWWPCWVVGRELGAPLWVESVALFLPQKSVVFSCSFVITCHDCKKREEYERNVDRFYIHVCELS